MTPDKYIVIVGNPVQGFSYVGPYDDPNDAAEAALEYSEADWWVSKLITP